MIYILSTTLNDNKPICLELTSLYGIGSFQSKMLCNFLNFGINSQVNELSQTQIHRLLREIDKRNLIIENNLQRQKRDCISRLIQSKSYRGRRHLFNLPVRGQRTRTNANTTKKLKIKY
jgi:small subunit ribosomal protein S13